MDDLGGNPLFLETSFCLKAALHWGFSPYLSRFLGRAAAVGINAMVSFCLDDDAWKDRRTLNLLGGEI